MSLFMVACRRHNISPKLLLKVVFDRLEARFNAEQFEGLFQECMVSDCFPTVAEDLALDILNGTMKVIHPKPPKKKGKGK